jgi:DNA replication and repair protein RecF
LLLSSLHLQHFRNYASLDARFAPGLVVVHGDNAQGKTNLLEAIYLLATTKSGRVRSDTEFISWQDRDPFSAVGFARIVGRVERNAGPLTLEIVVREGGEGTPRKRYKVNGTERRAGEMLGKAIAVFFAPHDVDLVAGSPSVRRRYLDIMLCQVEPRYVRALGAYNRTIMQRNALLRQIRERSQPLQALDYWNGQLCEQGAQVIAWRAASVRSLAVVAQHWHLRLSDTREHLAVGYRPALIEPPSEDLLASGGPLAAYDALQRSLAAVRDRETAAAVSLIGPHRDDLTFLVNDVDATAFGSRGQQRTATLALKLAEVAYMREQTGEQPILLLDDAASELDPHRRGAIMEAAAEGEQTFMTSTDTSGLPALPKPSQVWKVRSGTLTLETDA